MNENGFRIQVEHVSKKFALNSKGGEGALSRLLYFCSASKFKKEIQVLDDVSFHVKAGEILGLIGRNGSGKSTLLRMIAEVYFPDQGAIKIKGSVLYLAGLGQGLVSKLTMRENVYLTGSLMGLSQKDIRNKFSEIVDFSGLQDFTDAKVYQFSSGMVTRLQFSVMIHCAKHHRSDIILMDEVLGSFGDIDFHEKATAKMEELMSGGATIILVSHNMALIEKYCHRVIWMERGRLVGSGEAKEVTENYLKSTRAGKSNVK